MDWRAQVEVLRAVEVGEVEFWEDVCQLRLGLWGGGLYEY